MIIIKRKIIVLSTVFVLAWLASFTASAKRTSIHIYNVPLTATGVVVNFVGNDSISATKQNNNGFWSASDREEYVSDSVKSITIYVNGRKYDISKNWLKIGTEAGGTIKISLLTAPGETDVVTSSSTTKAPTTEPEVIVTETVPTTSSTTANPTTTESHTVTSQAPPQVPSPTAATTSTSTAAPDISIEVDPDVQPDDIVGSSSSSSDSGGFVSDGSTSDNTSASSAQATSDADESSPDTGAGISAGYVTLFVMLVALSTGAACIVKH